MRRNENLYLHLPTRPKVESIIDRVPGKSVLHDKHPSKEYFCDAGRKSVKQKIMGTCLWILAREYAIWVKLSVTMKSKLFTMSSSLNQENDKKINCEKEKILVFNSFFCHLNFSKSDKYYGQK